MLTKDLLNKEYSLCNQLISENIQHTASVPHGTFYTKMQHGKPRLFFYSNGKSTYISKNDYAKAYNCCNAMLCAETAKKLEQNLDLLSQLKTNYLFLENIAEWQQTLKPVSEQFRLVNNYLPDTQIKPKLYIPYENSSTHKISAWLNEPTVFNPFKPECKIHRTPSGILMRSKSEVLIGTLLETKNIPYKYEAALWLESGYVYPDFIIMRPSDCKIIIWEHLGLIHKPDYRYKNNQKLLKYLNNGYCMGDNLIITYDNNGSIDMSMLEKIISAYIL